MNPLFIDAVASLVCVEGPERVDAFVRTLESGGLDLSSRPAAIQIQLGLMGARLRPYGDVLVVAPSVAELVLALRIAVKTAGRIADAKPVVEIAWTYPGSVRPGLRTTSGVAREIIEGSRLELLIVGYAITTGEPTLGGLAAEAINAIARAAERGVPVTAVLHRGANRQALLSAWRRGVLPPSIFTWPTSDDQRASLHAKLIISDRRDGLITSANLTYHGFERNLEMGVRVVGRPAGEVRDRIHELIAVGELVPWVD